MKNNRVLKTVKVADINVENEKVKVDFNKTNHLNYYNESKKHYEVFGNFKDLPTINKNYEGLNCSFIVEVCKELGVEKIEVEIVDNNSLLNELYSINHKVVNLKLSNLENSRLVSRQVQIYNELGENGITKKVSEDIGKSQKYVQDCNKIQNGIKEELKEEMGHHGDIGFRGLKDTVKFNPEQQEEVKEGLVKQRVENDTKVDNKGYKIILGKVKQKSILDNTDTVEQTENTDKTEKIEQTEKPKVKKEKSQKRDLMKETIKFLIDTTQKLQKQQGEYDNSIFQEEFLKIQNHFNEIETYITQSSNNTDFEQEKKVS